MKPVGNNQNSVIQNNGRKPVSVLHVFGRMNRGGAEMRTLDVMRHLPLSRYHLSFCVLSGLPGELDEEIRRLGGEVYYCRLRTPRFPIAFIQLLRRGRFDVVHSHVFHFSGFILLLARISGIRKRVAHFRSSGDGKKTTVLKHLQRATMKHLVARNATDILAVGRNAMELAWGKNWEKDPRCTVITNGLDTSNFTVTSPAGSVYSELAIPPAAPLVIHIGRMTPAKNHLRLAEITALLLASQRNVYLILAGEEIPEVRNEMTGIFKKMDVERRVRFIGIRHDVFRLLRSADLLLFPSIREGIPGVVLEACAAGTRILASDIAGTRELADTYSDINLMSLGQPDEKWVEKATELLSVRPDDASRTNALASFRCSPYSIEHCIEAYEKVWG